MSGWMWWIIALFAVGGFSTVSETVRGAFRTRHKHRMQVLEARERERRELEAAGRPPEPICGCTHHLAKHDKQGTCHEIVEVPTAWDAERKPLRYEPGPCTCQQYVGPRPLSTVYADPLTDL